MTIYDELIQGAVDIHCHVDVEFSCAEFRKAYSERTWLPLAEAAGVRAVVLKSHLWPTMSVVQYLHELYRGAVTVLGSITLNPLCGGLDPWAVETAVQMGARAVFMPTWGARSDHEMGGFGHRLAAKFKTFDGDRLASISTLDSDGALSSSAHEILRLAKEYDVALSSGHLGWNESLMLAREAKALKFERFLFGHPLSGSVGAPLDAAREAASLGAYLEFCWPNISPGRRHPAEVVRLANEVGPSRIVLSSDYFGGNNPAPPDLLRMFLGTLLDAGMSQEAIQAGASANPAQLLGL